MFEIGSPLLYLKYCTQSISRCIYKMYDTKMELSTNWLEPFGRALLLANLLAIRIFLLDIGLSKDNSAWYEALIELLVCAVHNSTDLPDDE